MKINNILEYSTEEEFEKNEIFIVAENLEYWD